MRAAIVLALLLSACTAISGPCTREVTVTTNCEPTGSAVIFPPAN